MDDIETLAGAIRDAETAVALTGAGVSAPSGVQTFRGDDGVWDRFDEGQFAYGRFRRDPEGFWRDRLELQEAMFGGEYEPNAAHEALAAMERDGHLEAVCTQNTDGLHADAADAVRDGGNDATLLELHGNARRVRCEDCGRRRAGDPVFERAADGEIPPTCDCGGVYRPDVVLFGERLPGSVIQRAKSLARESDAFLAVGSSLVVEPVASLPRLAASSDATLGVINLEETPVDGSADAVLREDATDVLPRLRKLLESR